MVFLLSVPFFMPHHTAIAQEPSTTASSQSDSSSAPLSDEWKIKNALCVGPDFVTEKATVMDRPNPGEQHGTILRAGSNGWTCMPGRPGKPAHEPACADATMMKWLQATFAERKPNIDRVGIGLHASRRSFRRPKRPCGKTPPKGKDWSYVGPHVMIVLPNKDKWALKYVTEISRRASLTS